MFALRSSLRRLLFAVVAWGVVAAPSFAGDVVWIEEEWELVIGEPDAEVSAPQVSMVMSARGDLNDEYFVVTLNHQGAPSFTPGGVQVQLWRDDEIEDTRGADGTDALWHSNETVRWTQRLELNGSELSFELAEGQSETWGEFGSGHSLRLTTPTDLVNLNTYRPAVSIEDSGVSFGGNRVRSLTLKKLRWGFSDGEESELTAPIDVDTDIDP